MKTTMLTTALLLALAGCNNKGPGPMPPELYGSTWALASRTVATTSLTSSPTTVTTTVAPGTYSVVFQGNGKCTVVAGSTTLVGDCLYDGKTIAYGPLGASPAREVTVNALSASQLITVEKAQDATATYTTTEAYTR